MSTFRLPDLGEGLAEAEILEWHVQVGDHVRMDQPMVSLETAKSVVEVPAPFSGVVLALRGAPGDIVPTGAPLIDFDSGTVVGSMPAPVDELHSEHARGLDRSAGIGIPARQGGGPNGRAVPAARALAKRLGVDLSHLSGSGRGGLITIDDVLGVETRALVASPAPRVPEGGEAQPLRGARRAMAHSMTLSRDQVSGSTVCD